MLKKIHVGVIFGGRTCEHEVSIASAASIIQSLDSKKYDVTPLGVDKAGLWVHPRKSMQMLVNAGYLTPLERQAKEMPRLIVDREWEILKDFRLSRGLVMDVIFPMIHGPYGEDGSLQGLLEIVDIPYVGSGVAASAIAMDKGVSKFLCMASGIPVTDFLVISKPEWLQDKPGSINGIHREFSYPIFVKPSNMGSSVGITKVSRKKEIETAVNRAFRYDRTVIVEQGVNAREIEVGILGQVDPVVSEPGEVIPSGEYYDYKTKYTEGEADFLIPAKMPARAKQNAMEFALQAYKLMGCEGMARVDFLMNRKTGKIVLSEVNTLPGFTSTSVYPKLMDSAGYPYSDLLDKLISLAFEKYNKRKSLKSSLDRFK